MPVQMSFPMSYQQLSLGYLHYEDLILRAAKSKNRVEQLSLLLGCFLLYTANSAKLIKKPFNSLLGETFDFAHGETRVFSEQISHHPPKSAFYIENPEYVMESLFFVEMKMGWTCLDTSHKGYQKIYIKSLREWFLIENPNMQVRNLIWGKKYIRLMGRIQIRSLKNKDRAFVEYNTDAQDPEFVRGKVVINNETAAKLSGRKTGKIFLTPQN